MNDARSVLIAVLVGLLSACAVIKPDVYRPGYTIYDPAFYYPGTTARKSTWHFEYSTCYPICTEKPCCTDGDERGVHPVFFERGDACYANCCY